MIKNKIIEYNKIFALASTAVIGAMTRPIIPRLFFEKPLNPLYSADEIDFATKTMNDVKKFAEEFTKTLHDLNSILFAETKVDNAIHQTNNYAKTLYNQQKNIQ